MEVIIKGKAKKYLDKCDLGLKRKIFNEINQIILSPLSGGKLKGKLKGIFSWHFHYNKSEYRIAYTIIDNKLIIIITIGSRENFYKKM